MITRPMLVFWLEVYHELNRVNFHSLSDAETLIRATKYSPMKDMGMVFLQLKSPSLKKSKNEMSTLVKLTVMERVKIADS